MMAKPSSKPDAQEYDAQEAQRRMEAALRGARAVGPMHKTVTPKRPKPQRKIAWVGSGAPKSKPNA
jgi:hypothetical protein